ncbi:MAG: hypothetical protein AB1599_01440 [Planctomycetota bacterium]
MKNIIISIFLLLTIGCIPEKYSVSPDGRIAFPKKKSVYVTDKDVSFLKEIVSNEAKEVNWVEWSPDGSKLLYVSDAFYIIDRDGKNKRKIATLEEPVFLTEWSPDMRYISYAGESKTNKDEGGLYLYNIITEESTALVKNPVVLHKWSPDSRKIFGMRMIKHLDKTFKSGHEIMFGEIITVDVATGQIIPLAPYCSGGLTVIDYHPASQSIIFSSLDLFLPGNPITPDEEMDYSIYAVNITNNRISKITKDEPIMYFCLSPKKEKILYVVIDMLHELLHGELYVMDIGGRNKVRLGGNIESFVPFWVSEDIVGYQYWFGEGDARKQTVWLHDLKTGKKTNFTELVDLALKNKNK